MKSIDCWKLVCCLLTTCLLLMLILTGVSGAEQSVPETVGGMSPENVSARDFAFW
jgi:hypothetical protein